MGKLQINGDLLLAGNLMMSTSNISAYSVISVKPDSNAYGQNLIIGAGGNTVIGGGESASAFFTASGIKDEKNLYLTADGSIHVYTNCDPIANRKLVMSMGADGNITTSGNLTMTETKTIVLRTAEAWRAGIGYDTYGNECIALWAKNTVTRLRWYAGTDMTNMAAGTMMGITPDFEISKASGTAIGYIGGNTILHSNNYTSYTVTKTGSGASGTWGINVTGSAGSVAWANVTGKPSTFTPSDHTHSYLPLSGGTLTGNLTMDLTKTIVLRTAEAWRAGIGYDIYGNECIALWAKNTATRLRWYAGTDMTNMAAGTMMGITPDFEISKASGTAIGYIGGNTILHSNNYTSYTVTKTGSGASGTWGINVTGSAGSVAWGGVTGKPSTFPPSSHTHDYVPYGVNHSGVNFNTITNSGFHRVNSGNTNGPIVSDWGQLLVIQGGGDTITQIYGDYSSGNLFTRSGNPPDVGGVGSWTSWKILLNSDNYSSYCLPLSGGTMTGRITLASTGFQTNNVAGYYLDEYGNFFHSRASTGDHWQFHSYDQSISLKYYADTGDLLVPHIMKTQSITLTSTDAINFYGVGSGTYNCSMIYVDTTHGFQIETPRLTDSASGTILPCKISTRGGVPAPIHYSYAVSTNYGTGIPGTNTPGYGVAGAIYYKI